MKVKRPSSRWAELVAIVYCLAGAALVYVDALIDSASGRGWVAAVGAGAALVAGLVIGGWWALLLPLVVAIFSIPAALLGSWYVTDSIAPALVAIAVGVGLRKGIDVTRREGVSPSAVSIALAACYVVLAIAFMVYVASLAGSGDGDTGDWLFPAFIATHVALGLAFGKWRSLALVLLLPILAIPVPLDEDAYEPLPLWFAMLLWGAPAGAIAMAAGTVVRTNLGRIGRQSLE